MIDQLRAKADEAAIPVIAGDMTTAAAPGTYTLVYLVYNAVSNLLTQAGQVACFRNAARHLTPGGRFVIEPGSLNCASSHLVSRPWWARSIPATSA